jgi:hypothetical protein
MQRKCSVCGRIYDAEGWDQLPLARNKAAPEGVTVDGDTVVEWRHCKAPCRNTMAKQIGIVRKCEVAQ